jgi:hypothetical protein
MLCFRSFNPSGRPLDLQGVCQIIDEISQPGHFFLGPGMSLEWESGKAEEISWEIFRGRLLEPKHTRETRRFLSWNLYQVLQEGRSDEPLLSLKLDIYTSQVHVVRGLLCRVWESYDEGGNVILTRETCRWVRELVGTANLIQFTDLEGLRDELICLLWQAVVGTSRLPLNSLETPLPAFALGQLAYVYTPGLEEGIQPMQSSQELIQRGLHSHLICRERAKLLETVLRGLEPANQPATADLFLERWQELGFTAVDLARLFRTLFNEVSLSPWTEFVNHMVSWWRHLVSRGFFTQADQIDFLGYLLRQLGRHLTAYDLVLFHHRGANYPDALLLEAVLGEYLSLVETYPEDFRGDSPVARRRRRALRQGCLLRRFYEGHAVPDAPTSPGENVRILPEPFVAVPEDQVLQPGKRRKQLFLDRPLTQIVGPQGREIFNESLLDLDHPAERLELGTALFIDRPFGKDKAPGEPDHTPLLAHELFSVTLARKRWQDLLALAKELNLAVPSQNIPSDKHFHSVKGVPLDQVADPARPVVSLADASKVAKDFIVLRTLPGSLLELWALVDFTSLKEKFLLDFLDRPLVICRAVAPNGTSLVFWDEQGRRRLECEGEGPGFYCRAGMAFPSGGLRILRYWAPTEQGLEEREIRKENFVLKIR